MCVCVCLGTTIRVISNKGGGSFGVSIDNQEYVVSLSDLRANEEAKKEIEKKLAAFASFPEEEERKPKDPWPADMPLTVVCVCVCV